MVYKAGRGKRGLDCTRAVPGVVGGDIVIFP